MEEVLLFAGIVVALAIVGAILRKRSAQSKKKDQKDIYPMW